ncbi:MAG: phosphotransferase [Pseudomonadota bacterium]
MIRNLSRDDWIAQLFPARDWQIEAVSGDASFRHYFRLIFPDGATRIVMDAPPEHEDCRPFVKVAALLSEAGVHVPQVEAQDLDNGFLLLSDFGNTSYLDALNAQTAPQLYRNAQQALIALQCAHSASDLKKCLPQYDDALLSQELALFPTWYLERHLGKALDSAQQQTLDTVFASLKRNNLAQPYVLVHRDYHARNLMVTGTSFPATPGILDFQDAVYGPLSYDLVSLLRDAYIDWPEEQELDFVIRYWEMARQAGLPVASDFHDFYRDYEWMGAQRQLKVLGIFARLYHRDGKAGYLKDLPRVMFYLRRTCERYLELRPLARLFDQLEERSAQAAYTF